MNPKHFLTTIFIFIFTFSSHAQNNADEILVVAKGNNYRYIKNDKELIFRQLVSETKDSKEAQQLAIKAYNKRAAGIGTAFVGGCLVGYVLGDAIAKSKRNIDIEGKISIPLLVGGVGFLIGSYCFETSAKKNAKECVDIYNNYVKNKKSANIELGVSPSGINIKLNFYTIQQP